MAQQQAGNSPVNLGLIVGSALGILALIVTVLYDIGLLPGAVQAGEFIIALAGFFIAGLLAAKQVGRAKSGLVAGIVASLLPAIVIVGASVAVAAIAPSKFAAWFGYHDMTSGQLLVAALGQSLVGLVLWGVFGAVLGVLGGLVGRAQRRTVQASGN